MKRPVAFFCKRNAAVSDESVEKVGDILARPPCPAPLLSVEVFHGMPKRRRYIGVYSRRIEDRHSAPVAIVVQIALPEDIGIFGYDIAPPVADFNKRLERHGMRRKRREAFGPRLLDHMPE